MRSKGATSGCAALAASEAGRQRVLVAAGNVARMRARSFPSFGMERGRVRAAWARRSGAREAREREGEEEQGRMTSGVGVAAAHAGE